MTQEQQRRLSRLESRRNFLAALPVRTKLEEQELAEVRQSLAEAQGASLTGAGNPRA